MIRSLILFALLIAALWPQTGLSHAGTHERCGPRAGVIRMLYESFGETRRGATLPGSRAEFELYAAGLNMSFTITQAHPPGWLCMVAVGPRWNGKLPGGQKLRKGEI